MTFEEWLNSRPSFDLGELGISDLKAAWLASRKATLEEAAKVCQSHEPKDFTTAGIITRAKCAQVILALIVDNPQAKVANRPDEG